MIDYVNMIVCPNCNGKVVTHLKWIDVPHCGRCQDRGWITVDTTKERTLNMAEDQKDDYPDVTAEKTAEWINKLRNSVFSQLEVNGVAGQELIYYMIGMSRKMRNLEGTLEKAEDALRHKGTLPTTAVDDITPENTAQVVAALTGKKLIAPGTYMELDPRIVSYVRRLGTAQHETALENTLLKGQMHSPRYMQTSEYLKEVDGLKKRIDEVCAENTRLINKIIWLETPKDFDLLKANQTIKELTEVRDVLTKALEFGPDQECSACTFGREDGNEECETCRVKRSQYRPKGTCKHV